MTLFRTLAAAAFGLALLAVPAVPRAAELSPQERAAVDRILSLTEERLTVAPMVAEAKWNSGAPISVPEREAAILEGVTERATQAGVDPALARAFFQAQFEASKILQTAFHETWHAEKRPPFEHAPDLGRDVRPLLDRLTPQLVEALRRFQALPPGAEAVAYLREQATARLRGDVEGRIRAAAVAPLEARLTP